MIIVNLTHTKEGMYTLVHMSFTADCGVSKAYMWIAKYKMPECIKTYSLELGYFSSSDEVS